jgi:hypothetical protein
MQADVRAGLIASIWPSANFLRYPPSRGRSEAGWHVLKGAIFRTPASAYAAFHREDLLRPGDLDADRDRERFDVLEFGDFPPGDCSNTVDKFLIALSLRTDGSPRRSIEASRRSVGTSNIARATAHRNFIAPWFLSSTSSSGSSLIVVSSRKNRCQRTPNPKQKFRSASMIKTLVDSDGIKTRRLHYIQFETERSSHHRG